jgi:hypothetical protein
MARRFSKAFTSILSTMTNFRQLLGSYIGLFLGIVTLISGITSATFNAMLAGQAMVLCSLAYQSAKRRRLSLVTTTKTRLVLEGSAVTISILLAFLRNDVRDAIATDPVPSLIIPLWCFIAYAWIATRRRKGSPAPQ